MAERYEISLELIGKLLQSLAKSNLIISTQGVKGGYELQQKPETIKINDVICAVDGPIHMTRCAKDQKGDKCEREDYCNIKHTMSGIQSQIIGFLDNITLSDFAKSLKTSA